MVGCTLLLQCLAPLGVIAYYLANHDYIAKQLCENRNKPAMKCDGKCYLKKQLRKVDNGGENSNKIPVKIEKNEIEYCILSGIIHYQPPVQFPTGNAQHPVVRNLFDKAVAADVFHPPQAV